MFIEDPPNLKRVATLPWEIRVHEIAMLKNCVNTLARKTQTATHFRVWWGFSYHFTANLSPSLTVKEL